MAPRIWKRPMTHMYDNNYQYGTGLYSGAIGDIEKKYLSSMSRTHLPTDRPDVNLSTFAGSSLTAGHPAKSSSDFDSAAFDLRKAKSVADLDLYRTHQDLANSRMDIANSRMDLASSWTPTFVGTSYPSRASHLETIAHQEVEEARRNSRRRQKRREDMANLELAAITASPAYHSRPISGYEKASDHLDYGFWTEKCRHFQSELDSVVQRLAEAESIIKAESISAKSKLEQGINQIAGELEDSSRHSTELQRVIKRQANHLAELNSLYEEVQRHLLHANEELSNSQRRCSALKSELDSVRNSVEQVPLISYFTL